MIKVIVKNLLGVETHGGRFPTQEQADQWIEDCKATNSWGLKAGWYPESFLTGDQIIAALETRSLTDQEVEHRIADQFTIETTDITVLDNKEKAALAAQQERDACMKVLSLISAHNKATLSPGPAADAQMDAFFANGEFIAIILALLTGSPKTASRKMKVVGPSIYPQVVVDEMTAILDSI